MEWYWRWGVLRFWGVVGLEMGGWEGGWGIVSGIVDVVSEARIRWQGWGG